MIKALNKIYPYTDVSKIEVLKLHLPWGMTRDSTNQQQLEEKGPPTIRHRWTCPGRLHYH